MKSFKIYHKVKAEMSLKQLQYSLFPLMISNTNRIYHITFKVECPHVGKMHRVNFFYRHRSGHLLDDINSCPLYVHLNQDSTVPTIIAPENAIPGSHPPVDTVNIGEER